MKCNKREEKHTLFPKFDIDPGKTIQSNSTSIFIFNFIYAHKRGQESLSPTYISQVNQIQTQLTLIILQI